RSRPIIRYFVVQIRLNRPREYCHAGSIREYAAIRNSDCRRPRRCPYTGCIFGNYVVFELDDRVLPALALRQDPDVGVVRKYRVAHASGALLNVQSLCTALKPAVAERGVGAGDVGVHLAALAIWPGHYSVRNVNSDRAAVSIDSYVCLGKLVN